MKKMPSNWDVLMEGDLPTPEDDWKFAFIDIRDEFPEPKILNMKFFDDLLEVLRANDHYQAILQIKEVKSTTGDSLPINSCMVLSAAGKEQQFTFNLLFHMLSTDEYQIVGMWPPNTISAFIENEGLLERLIVALIKSPEIFKFAYVFVPIQL